MASNIPFKMGLAASAARTLGFNEKKSRKNQENDHSFPRKC